MTIPVEDRAKLERMERAREQTERHIEIIEGQIAARAERITITAHAKAQPENDDIRLFGLMDLGLGMPELGYAMFSEIEDLRGGLGLPVERDLHFRAEYRLSLYAKLANLDGRVVA